MLRQRSAADEIMDDASVTEAEFSSALTDLERINRMSLAYRPVLRWLDRVVAAKDGGARRLSVLDVGAGGGDMLQAVAAWGEERGVALDLAGLDRSPWAGRHAAARGRPGRWITADLFDLDPAERFDVVLCSLFAHHLPHPVLVRFLRWLDARADRGWLVSDLHRHPVPWAVVWAGVRLLRMDPMVVHDSTVSIARGFARSDWDDALREAGVAAEIRWAFPFRWQVGTIRV